MKSDMLQDFDKFEDYLTLIESAKITRSLIVFTNEVSTEDLENLKHQVAFRNVNAMFQFMYQDQCNDLTKYYQVISIKNGAVVINPIKLNEHGHMIDNYDLQVRIIFKLG